MASYIGWVHRHENYNRQFLLQITRLGIVHYGLKSWKESVQQYINPFNVPSYGAVEKAELLVHRKVSSFTAVRVSCLNKIDDDFSTRSHGCLSP